ncbi:DMT family transporter [Candidatus Micrarchaeota archaeon]|nr:DMT family transporter [Candidatus Micrarchaeota archaeon]
MGLLGIAFALLTPNLWALSDLGLKFCLKKESWWKILVLAQLFGGIFMLAVSLLAGENLSFPIEWIGWVILLSLIALVATAAYYRAMDEREMALASPICNSWGIVTILLGVLFLGEAVNPMQWAAILLIMGGVFAISLKKGAKLEFDISLAHAVVSMLFWGMFFFLLKLPGEVVGAAFIIAIAKLLTGTLIFPMLSRKGISIRDTALSSIALIALMGALDAGGFLAYLLAINELPLYLVAPIASAVPVLGVLLGVLVLKERPGRLQALGIVCAIAGTIILAL